MIYLLGAVKTNLGRDDETFKRQRRMTIAMYIPPELACQTILYCAIDDKLANESGEYYANCNKYTNDSCSMTYYLASNACDDEVAQKLWDLSCDLVKLEDKYFYLINQPIKYLLLHKRNALIIQILASLQLSQHLINKLTCCNPN